ncbi:MAG TPA: PAS domain-containing protein, partial [Azospirillum sp.]
MHSSSAITWAISWALAAMLAACLGWLWCQRRALHESRARRQETEAHMRLHAALLDHVSVAVLAVDREGRVVYWNRVAETLFGWPVEAAIGRPVEELDVLPDVRPPTGGFLDSWDGAWDGDGVARHRDGRRFPVR